MRDKLFKDRYGIEKTILISAFINASIIEFSQIGSGMIDGIIISRTLGETAMAASGMAAPIFSVMGMFSAMLSVGMQITCSAKLGVGNKKEFNRIFSGVFYLGIIIGAIITACIILFSPQIAAMLGASKDAEIAKYTTDYLVGVAPTAISAFAVWLLSPVVTLDDGKKLVSIGAAIQAISNIIFDLLVVKFNLGIIGIGYGTSAAFFLNMLFLCTHFFKKNRMLKFERVLLSPKEYFKIFIFGTGKIFIRLGNILRPITLNRLIIFYGGTIAMSALSIRNNFSGAVFVATVGLAEATRLLVSIYFGEKNDETIEAVYGFANKLGLVVTSIIGVLLIIFSRSIVRIYVVNNPELEKLVIFAIWMLALNIPVSTIVNLRIAYLEATYKVPNVQIYSFATNVVFILVSAFIFGKLYGVHGVLACYLGGDLLASISLYVVYAVKYRTAIPRLPEFMDLPKDFHIAPQNVIELDVRDIEDASLVSEQISMFCKGHKIDAKISYYAALAFEELAVNTITYGFPKNKDNTPYIDVRVVANNGTLTIRMKDNCPRFDTTAGLNASMNDSSIEKIGLKMIRSVAKNIRYINYLDTNVTIIEF